MADSIANMIVGNALQQAQKAPDIVGSYAKGAELAQTMQNMQLQREQLELTKQKAEIEKLSALTGMLETGLTRVPKKAQPAYFKGVRDNVAGKLKIGMTDEFFDALTSPDVNQGAVGEQIVAFRAAAKEAAQTGDYTKAKEMASGLLAAFGGDVTKFGDFMNTTMGSETSARAQVLAAEATAKRQKEGQAFSAGQEDKKTAESYGKKLVELGIPNLKVTLGKIDSKVIPGGFDNYDGKSQIEGVGGKQSLITAGNLSAKGRANRQLVQDAVNDYIKMLTGAGVGVTEAVRLGNAMGMDMAIGEGGGVEALFKGTKSSANVVEGLKNLRDKMKETENTLKAGAGPGAIAFYESNKKQLDEAGKPKPKKLFKDLSPAVQEAAIAQYAKIKNITPEEARKKLGGN